MALAIFDLDRTLIATDSDHAWGEFLAEQSLVDGEHYARENDRFYQAYQAGTLDIQEYLNFALRPLMEHDRATLEQWRREFVHSKVMPMIKPAARVLLDKHRDLGDTLIIITSTNDFITRPIAAELGVEHLIATRCEIIDGRYTGRVSGTPCYRDGKVQRLREWMHEHNETLNGSWFYSDSHNDLPLLNLVTHPVAVNPDRLLREQAETRGWPIIELR
ncbi:MAG: HAD family hydrolase [Acidiferrobacterales bacterium]